MTEGIVNNQRYTMSVSYCGKFGNVRNIVLRVSNTFDIHRFSVFVDSSSNIIRVVAFNELYSNSVLFEEYLELVVRLRLYH